MKQFTREEAIAFLQKKQDDLGLSNTDFADKLGVSPQYLANVYGGKVQLPSEKVGFTKVKSYLFKLNGKLDDLVHS